MHDVSVRLEKLRVASEFPIRLAWQKLLVPAGAEPKAYVMPYPGPGERVRISDGGARVLRWGRDAIFYLSGDGRFVSVPVKTTPALQTGAPTTLFKISTRPWADFEVAPDGSLYFCTGGFPVLAFPPHPTKFPPLAPRPRTTYSVVHPMYR